MLSNVERSVKTLYVHPEEERQLCKRILQEVLSNGELKTPGIVKILGTSTEQVEHSLSLLVSCNLLRFTSGGMVAFHSKLVKWAFERDMIDAQYHKIPKDPSGSIHYVLTRLEKQAEKYKSKHGRTPVLVIDGIDLLAKRNKEMFVDLVDRAKYLANSSTLKIILVSSEGSVMPLVTATSSKSRLADTVEVLDVSDEDAVKFFSNSLVPNELAQKIVSVCGGRFVHLR